MERGEAWVEREPERAEQSWKYSQVLPHDFLPRSQAVPGGVDRILL